jgi:hypothetical protein
MQEHLWQEDGWQENGWQENVLSDLYSTIQSDANF